MRNISYICYKRDNCDNCDKCDKLPHPSLVIANNHERE